MKKEETKTTTQKHEETNKPFLYAILALLVVAFFYVALSQLNSFAKIAIIAVTLFASGSIISKLTGDQSHYGLVILRGTKGFNLMQKIADKHPRLCNELADLGLSLGFGSIYAYYLFSKNKTKLVLHIIALILLFGFANSNTGIPKEILILIGLALGLSGLGIISIFQSAFKIATIPGSPAGVMPVVPGVTVPLEAIVAIILIAVIHETAHGVLFYIEKIKLKHSGALLLGFIPVGAFVEPDEKEFDEHELNGKRRILVAGSASNFYTFLAVMPVIAIFGVLLSGLSAGVVIQSLAPNSSASQQLQTGQIITHIDGVEVKDTNQLLTQLASKKPETNVNLTLQTGENKIVTLNQEAKMGIGAANAPIQGSGVQYTIATLLMSILNWTALLSLALAVINLLPLFITDGHKLIAYELESILKDKKKASLITNGMGIVMVIVLIFNALPLIK